MTAPLTEHPILFSTEMVKAILEGKTQTRRVMKPQPFLEYDQTKLIGSCGMFAPTKIDRNGEEYPGEDIFGFYTDDGKQGWKCPYGKIGDRLWVRETWKRMIITDYAPEYVYATDDDNKRKYKGFWRPSIFMPREASRITLEITNIRVERVQEISEADAKAEGCISDAVLTADKSDYMGLYASERFQDLWNSINGKRKGCSWEDNPWVWIIEFERWK